MKRAQATRSRIAGLILACAVVQTVPATAEELALLPLKRRARNAEAAAAVEAALELQLTQFGTVARGEKSRDAMRRRRLRDPETASPEVITDLAAELGANWLVAATLHDVPSHSIPDLAVSIRVYDRASGELSWVGFQGRSGLDGRKVLGIGVQNTFTAVASELIELLLAEAPFGRALTKTKSVPSTDHLAFGRLAIVPFTSYVDRDALAVAETVTEAARAVLFKFGTDLASSSCVHESLRRQRAQVWGEVTEEARDYLASNCGAAYLLTGSVEFWSTAGSGLEPEPKIALSVRVLDAKTGRIQWMGSKETSGWDRGSFFGLRRIFSRGDLLDKILTNLIENLRPQEVAAAI